MENEIAYEFLWQAVQKEKGTNELQPLPKTFYTDVAAFLKSLEGRELSDNEAAIKKNTIRMASELFERRKQKLLIYAAYHRQLPQPSVPQEADFYARVVSFAEENRLNIANLAPTKSIMLKSLQTIPEIILPSGRKTGPFQKGQAVEVENDEEDIKYLVNNTICQRQ